MGKEKDQLCTLLITFTDFDDPVKQITTVHSFSSMDPRHYPQRRRIVHRETTAADADKEDEPTVTVTRSAESAGIGNLGTDMIERGLVYGLQDERIPGSKIQALNAHEVSVSYKRDTFEQQLLPRGAADAPRMGTFTVTYPVPPRTDEAVHRRQYSDISDTMRQEQRVYEPESRTGAFYSVPMKVHASEERVKKVPPLRPPERRTPPVTMPLEQHARSFESIHESVSRSRKGTRLVYERRTSEEILTRRTGNGRPRSEHQKPYGAPRPEELHRYQQRERRLPRYHEDDIRLYTRYDDSTRQAEGRHRLPERYRPATAPPPPPYREPPPRPVTTTHFAEEVITTEEHMISRGSGRPPPPPGLTPFGSKQSFTKVTNEKPIPPAVEETRRRERVVETKEPEILKPRLIDYETYRKELERLQSEATRSTREPEEPRPLPLAPTIVVPHSPRPRELKDPRAIKYFASTEVEEHEEYIHRGRPYPPPSPTPANTPATPYAEQRAAAEKAREASLESFREKIDVLRSSHRFRPLHQEAPVESPPSAALSPTSDTTQRAESVSPSRFAKPQTPVPTPEPPREREPSPSPMKRVIEETILVLEERKTTGIRADESQAREEQPLSPTREFRKEELVIETKILDFSRPDAVPGLAAPPPTAVVPEVPPPFSELPQTTETGTGPDPVPHGVDVQTQKTEQHEDIGTQMELVTSVTETGTQSEVSGETDADRRLLETLRRELQYEEIVDYEIQRRIRERHEEKKPTAEEQPRIEEVTEFPVVEEEEEIATTFPADDSGYHEQLLSPIPEARKEEFYIETKVAEFVQPQELPAPVPEEEDEARFEETVEIDVHQRFIEEQRRRIDREQAKRREAEEAQKRAQEAAEEEQRSFEERVDIETRETMASVERRPKKAATPPKVSPKPSPVTVKRAPSPVRTTTTTELKFRPFEPSSSPSPRMEYHNGAEYRSTISSRSGFARTQRVLSPTPTGGRMLKLVSETSSIASGLSPYGGSTAASTIRDTRERERKEMSDLNDRLASYIEKVRFLEAQNRKLAADLDHLRSRWGRDATSVRDMYEGDLRQAQKVIDETNRQREDLEREIRKLQEEIADYRHRYDDALRAHGIDKSIIDELIVKLSGLESEVNILKRRIALVEGDVGMTKRENHHLIQELQRARIDVDQETLNRIDYQNQVQALLEEIGFLKRAHDSEIHDLQAMASRDTTSENREFFKNELASAIREIREEYDKICSVQRTDMESWYRLKVQEIQTQSARQSMEQTYAKDEVKRLRVNLGDLRGKLADLEARNSILEKQAEELNYQLEDDQRSYESALNDRDVQIRKIRDECQTLMVELQMLLDTKQTLDAEIAIYRKMLEGEEDRAGLRQLVEQVVRTHHHKHTDETETTRVLRGETASRQSYQRSAKGNVSISEADPHGKFIILENTHRSKEEHIGEWKLKRKLDGRREVVYTFPRDFILKPAKTVKIWARNQGLHNPPDQLVFDGEDTFGSGNNVHTILYNTQGEERATLIQRTSQTVTGH